MSRLHPSLPTRASAAAVLLFAVLSAGCWRPLSVQHEFFSPVNGTIAKSSALTQHTVSRHRALQAARHACKTSVSGFAAPPGSGGPDLGLAAARNALADLCATPTRPATAAYGATSNAYRRWVEDQVRDLPALSETAASAAGGS